MSTCPSGIINDTLAPVKGFRLLPFLNTPPKLRHFILALNRVNTSVQTCTEKPICASIMMLGMHPLCLDIWHQIRVDLLWNMSLGPLCLVQTHTFVQVVTEWGIPGTVMAAANPIPMPVSHCIKYSPSSKPTKFLVAVYWKETILSIRSTEHSAIHSV